MDPRVKWGVARKKPVVVKFREVNGATEQIPTLEGVLTAVRGRHIIVQGVKGELYPVEREIFKETYEVVKTLGS